MDFTLSLIKYHFFQVSFDDNIRKYSITKPIKARIVRIELPADDKGRLPCIKVELHGIIVKESSGVKYLYFNLLIGYEIDRFKVPFILIYCVYSFYSFIRY